MKSRNSDQVNRQFKHGDRQRKVLRNALRSFETLEDRRLLTVEPWSDGLYYPPIGVNTAYLPPTITYQEYAAISAQQYGTGGATGGSNGGGEGLGFTTVNEVEPNDVFAQATPLNLGTGTGNYEGVTVIGTLTTAGGPFGTYAEEDYFRTELRAGDIIDAAVNGSIIAGYDVSFYNAARQEIIGNDRTIGTGYPLPDSPLSTGNNTNLAFVVPADGTYYIRIGEANTGAPTTIHPYTMNLRARRPVLESEPVGTVQKIFLDFDGQTVRRETWGAFGTARLSPLSSFLAGWGLQPEDENRIIDKIVEDFTSKFYGQTAISGAGGNGDYFASGRAGEFGIEILNSRDHADPFGQPHVSRIIIGGTQTELGIGTIGIAQSIDVGNFDTTESAVTLLDNINTFWGPIPRAANVPLEDVLVDAIASVSVHEAGHFFGGWHTLPFNGPSQIMDTGGNIAGLIGVGADGIYGTPDDTDVQFGTDTYDPFASSIPFGQQNSAATLAWGLSTGTAGGGTVSGKVFNDRNVNRSFDSADAPLANVQIYADLNGDGNYDAGEYQTFSNSNGDYVFDLPPGTYTLRETIPSGYRITTPVTNSLVVTVTAGATLTNRHFGNELLNQDITGMKFNDANGNGVRDAGEGGIGGVWIYLDLDGDNRIDIGEPSTQSAANGTYKLSFPGPGTYSVREVVDAGYVQTFPGVSDDADPSNDFEHTVVLTGDPAIDASRIAGLDFGNRLTVDFGDAPSSYGVASHGFVDGLILGTAWDAEQASQFSATATGDDENGNLDVTGAVIDDEDGVILSRPLVAGSTNNRITVTAQNATGNQAYLHGWVDFNQDGDFGDAGEHIISNAPVSNGSNTVTFSAPAGSLLGETVARFRYSNSQNLSATGSAASGEVEDYIMTVVDTLDLAVNDRYTVTRNSQQNELDVLANDFRLPGENLTIVSVNTTGTAGLVQITPTNTIRYTPPNSFIGQDIFEYTIENSGGDRDTATVIVDVSLFFEDPKAIDDSFDVATNSVDFPLNVLANDIEGAAGALTIISLTQPNRGGQVSIATGGKSLRYTPPRDFGDTESFTYTVADSAGKRSTATVTLHTLPGDRADDDIQIRLAATDLSGNPISAIQQGQDFIIQFIVDDLRHDNTNPGSAAGVYAAYADLLYNLQLVSTVPSSTSGGFNFDVGFFNDYDNFQTGDATFPGIIDEFGAFSTRTAMDEPNELLLAEVRFSARAPGIARFTPDPADNLPLSDSLLFDTPGSPVPIQRIRYIGASLEIVGDGVQFPVAVDDSVPGSIPMGSVNFPINVLANDRPGSTGQITLVDVTDGAFGLTSIDTRGTSNPADDRILYTPNGGFTGADQFTYTIQDSRGIQSTARVTVRVGDADANDVISMRLSATDLNGQPIDEITVGSQFQLRGYVQDIRGFGFNRGAFAAYEDVLYTSTLVSPVASNTNDPDLGFQVTFGPNYSRVREGDIRTPGVINEIGAVQIENGNQPLGSDEQLLFVVTMTANGIGTANFIGDPADITPLHDTLTFEPPEAVGFDRIRYGFDTLNIVGRTGGGNGEGWYNGLDVNADGYVTAIDALGVINWLNDGGSRDLPNGGGEGEHGGDHLYVDTNNDGSLSPIDALLVINHLNKGSGGNAEGEFSAILSSGSLAQSASGVTSSSVASAETPALGGDTNGSTIGSRLTGENYGPSLPAYFAATDDIFDDANDEIEDLLSQIAPDISGGLKKDRLS